MTHYIPRYTTLDDWITSEAIPFSIDVPKSLGSAIDKVVASLGKKVEVLGFGEALHGGEGILLLRNRLFQHLVEAHSYSAIAIESSFPRSHVVNEYVLGRGLASYEAVRETGISHGFGRIDANGELIEWMRRYNADPSHRVKLQFYGFDSPTEMTGSDSPRQVLHFVLDYLALVDDGNVPERRQRIDTLLGQDADWENPAAMMDPTKAVGRSPAANGLRIEVEDLISELRVRRPELVAKSDDSRYLEAMQYAAVARWLLNYHAALAETSDERYVKLLGMRDALMADNVAYIVSREQSRGKVFIFAHNSHLQRGKSQWQWGPESYIWWPVGSHLNEMFGPGYAVIGTAVGVSVANGIGKPEPGTLENRLTAVSGPARFIPTHRGQVLPASELAALPIRSGSKKNLSYFALTPQSLSDFDWLAVLDATAYSRGIPWLDGLDEEPQS